MTIEWLRRCIFCVQPRPRSCQRLHRSGIGLLEFHGPRLTVPLIQNRRTKGKFLFVLVTSKSKWPSDALAALADAAAAITDRRAIPMNLFWADQKRECFHDFLQVTVAKNDWVGASRMKLGKTRSMTLVYGKCTLAKQIRNANWSRRFIWVFHGKPSTVITPVQTMNDRKGRRMLTTPQNSLDRIAFFSVKSSTALLCGIFVKV